MEQALAQPHVEPVKCAGNLPNLPEGHGAVGQTVEYTFQVEEAAVGLDAEVVQGLCRVSGHVLTEARLRVQAPENVALHVQGHVTAAEVVQRYFAETWNYRRTILI